MKRTSFFRFAHFSSQKSAVSRWITAAALAVALPVAAFADLTNTVTLQNNGTFSFDTGATATSGGDILFASTGLDIITPQGKATIFNQGVETVQQYNALTQATLTISPQLYTFVPIIGGMVAVNNVFFVHTNGGNYAKAQITAVSASSITFTYDTFGVSGSGGGGGGANAPTITDVENNSSVIPAGFPNSGISPSTLFVIHGNNLANAGTPSLQNTANGLPLTLNGASISVTVGGKTVQPAIYYTCSGTLGSASGCGAGAVAASQIAAVLPAATPIGTGTLTVTTNGATSAPATIQVVPNALGFNNYNGGTAVAQNVNTGALLTPTASGFPGQVITLWATGLGADPQDSDTTYTTTPHSPSVSLQVYIGGIQANLIGAGASVYPGTNQINVTIPQSVTPGCYVPVVGVIGNVVSNTVTLPVAVGGGVCSEPEYGLTGTQITSLSGQSTVRSGVLIVEQGTSPNALTGAPQTLGIAFADFSQVTGASYSGGGIVSLGGCLLNQYLSASSATTSTGLSAGTITVTPPSGGPITLTSLSSLVPGIYEAQLPAGAIPTSGGTFAFNATAGSQVGSFSNVAVTFPNPLLTWNNQSDAATVTRSSGLLVQWTGGASGSYVIIDGSSSSSTSGVFGSYSCIAPVSAGSFTVPSYILLGLPAGTGTTLVENSTNYTSFTASGLDHGAALGAVAVTVNSTYK